MPDKKGHSRTASRGRAPSLKQLSERLPAASPNGSAPALSEITSSTNLPSPTEPRLKLPPSALARANLAPLSATKIDENTAVGGSVEEGRESKEAKKDGKVDAAARDGEDSSSRSEDAEAAAARSLSRRSSTATLKNSDCGDDAPSTDSSVKKEGEISSDATIDQGEGKMDGTAQGRVPAASASCPDVKDFKPVGLYRPKAMHKSHASIGRGLPRTLSPTATPERRQQQVGNDVPEITVERSTPRTSPEKPIDSAAASGTTTRIEPPSPRAVTQPLPLSHSWTLLYDSKTYRPPPDVFAERKKTMNDWEASMLPVGTFNTVQDFARLFNNVRQPSGLVKGASYHLFKDGIRPSWEDPANTNGGRWVIFVRGGRDTDTSWANLVLGLVGDMLDPDNAVTGIVVSLRPKMDRIQIWTRSKHDYDALNALGQRIVDTIDADPRDKDSVSLEFQSHEGPPVPSNKFMRVVMIQQRSVSMSVPSSAESSRRSSPRLGPTSPGGVHTPLAHSPLSPHAHLPPSPRGQPGNLPSLRSRSGTPNGSGGGAFSGNFGTARRLFSTPME